MVCCDSTSSAFSCLQSCSCSRMNGPWITSMTRRFRDESALNSSIQVKGYSLSSTRQARDLGSVFPGCGEGCILQRGTLSRSVLRTHVDEYSGHPFIQIR